MPDLEVDESGNGDPCPEDEEFFDSRPDAETMEEAIGKFMDGMEAQERDGFKDLHQFVGRLPVPTVNASQAMSHKDALEGGNSDNTSCQAPEVMLLYVLIHAWYIQVQT